jgi:hypothetical protein
MTTIESISLLKPVTYAEISSCEAEDWQHPMLEMFRPVVQEHEKQKARLYLIPSSFDDEYDPDFSPQPTSASDLPELHEWTMRFVVSVLEIWAADVHHLNSLACVTERYSQSCMQEPGA